jgi:hypothetical protein
MREPLVSALMSVRDGDRYLADAIDSILEQTWRNLECIVVDDGSEDSSPPYRFLEYSERSCRDIGLSFAGFFGVSLRATPQSRQRRAVLR